MKTFENITSIIIPKPTDKTYGYLSNDSKHGFTEDSYGDLIYWPTVTHFIEAKKFEGTQYENEIRKARTVLQAKRMAKEKKIIIKSYTSSGEGDDIGSLEMVKKKTYGLKKDAINIQSNWNKAMMGYIKLAIKLKFKQNKNLIPLLLSTVPNIISAGDNAQKVLRMSVIVITQLRTDLYTAMKNSKLSPKGGNPVKNIAIPKNMDVQVDKPKTIESPKSTDLKIEIFEDKKIKIIVRVIQQLSKYISQLERYKKVHPKNVNSAIFNIYPHKSKIIYPQLISIGKLFNDDGSFKLPQSRLSEIDGSVLPSLQGNPPDDSEILLRFFAMTKKSFNEIDPKVGNKSTKRLVSFVILLQHNPKMKSKVCKYINDRFGLSQKDINFGDVKEGYQPIKIIETPKLK